ncbi:hypothetical protein CHS0354_040552 [Potamilus streckersoni]|uniref:Uncharacterized protein n=1 Tax=Potamilus streckersoni TaxID=2493646 RepID=A0AAE0VUY7_9BIVA|nr:hypothetical protein CHS0354_040552 [Potamilus streckersoni]
MATRLITVKLFTNTRGRAYQCLKCPTDEQVIEKKSKVVTSTRSTRHKPSTICQYQRELEIYVQYYPAHREKIDHLRELGCPVNEEENLLQNLQPYIPGDHDMEVLGREDSERIWREIISPRRVRKPFATQEGDYTRKSSCPYKGDAKGEQRPVNLFNKETDICSPGANQDLMRTKEQYNKNGRTPQREEEKNIKVGRRPRENSRAKTSKRRGEKKVKTRGSVNHRQA